MLKAFDANVVRRCKTTVPKSLLEATNSPGPKLEERRKIAQHLAYTFNPSTNHKPKALQVHV